MVVAYASAVEKPVLEFENRICDTGPALSVAESVNVAVRELVTAAPPLITIVPVGAWLSTVTLTTVATPVLPAASRARADSVCGPLLAVVVFQLMEYGEVVSSAPRVAPSRRNCTPTTPTLSVAVALSVTVALTVLPLAGDAPRVTVGGVVSGVAVTVRGKVVARTRLPAVPVTVIVDVASGVDAVVVIVIVVAQPGEHDDGA